MRTQIYALASRNPAVPAQLVERHFPQLNCLGTFVKNQLTIYVRVYFSTLKFYFTIWVYIIMILPHDFDYCSLAVNFEISQCVSSNLFFSRLLGLFWVLCIFMWILRSACQFLPQVSWDSIMDWIYRSRWGVQSNLLKV